MTTEDDTASADVPAPPNEPPTIIKFVLPNAYRDDKDHYAVANLPPTYQNATVDAVRLLGRYMFDPTPENTILRCSTKNREEQWVWADILPQDWDKMINRFGSKEIGIFEDKLSVKKSSREFVDGEVMLAAGKVAGSQIAWTELFTGHADDQKPRTPMSRPKSYKEAVDFVKDMIKRDDDIGNFYTDSFLADIPRRESFAKSLTTFKFFYFLSDTSTKTRVEFPPEAYRDDEYWRSIVPLPGSILGVIVK